MYLTLPQLLTTILRKWKVKVKLLVNMLNAHLELMVNTHNFSLYILYLTLTFMAHGLHNFQDLLVISQPGHLLA